MNAEMMSAAQARAYTHDQLVTELVRVAGRNNECDCRDALAVLEREVRRRLKGQP